MPDSMAPEDFRDWNEQMVQRYDPEVFHHHPRGIVRWVESRRVRTVIRCLGAAAEHQILDVGCGGGNLLALLPGSRRCGIDLSAPMIKRAHERLGRDAALIHGDAEQLPFADESFDRVVLSSVLSHVLHPERVIAEIRRVTRPGGRIVISISHEEQIERGIRWAKALGLDKRFFGNAQAPGEIQVYNVEYHLHRFAPKRVIDLVGDRLKIVKTRRVPLIFPVHWVGVYEREH